MDLNDLYCFDVATQTWYNKYNHDSHIPKSRRRHSAVFIGRSMVLFGGFDGRYLNDMYYINVKPFGIQYQPENIHKHYLSLVNNPKYSNV